MIHDLLGQIKPFIDHFLWWRTGTNSVFYLNSFAMDSEQVGIREIPWESSPELSPFREFQVVVFFGLKKCKFSNISTTHNPLNNVGANSVSLFPFWQLTHLCPSVDQRAWCLARRRMGGNLSLGWAWLGLPLPCPASLSSRPPPRHQALSHLQLEIGFVQIVNWNWLNNTFFVRLSSKRHLSPLSGGHPTP